MSLPPLTSAASATATWSGDTAMPWPKATVIAVRSDHFFGMIGSPISGNSVFGPLKKPKRLR